MIQDFIKSVLGERCVFYIDVGSDGKIAQSFYDAGNSGITANTSVDAYEGFLSDRPRDVNLLVGIGEKDESRDGVTFLTIETLRRLYVPKKQEVDVLILGRTVDFASALLGADWTTFHPQFVAVWRDGNDRWSIRESMDDKGYSQVAGGKYEVYESR